MSGAVIVAIIAAFGNLLQGWDNATIAGAVLYIKKEFHLETAPTLEGLIVAMSLIGATLITTCSGPVSDSLGRRPMLILASMFYFLGGLVMMWSPNVYVLLFARLLDGFGVGLSVTIVPVYISETAPPEIRGLLNTLPQFSGSGGMLIAYCMVFWMSLMISPSWRLMLGVLSIPSLFYFAMTVFYLPESPRWLVSKGRMSDAKVVLQKLRSREDVAGELALLVEGLGVGGDTSIEEYIIGPAGEPTDDQDPSAVNDQIKLYGPEAGLSWVARPVRQNTAGAGAVSRHGSMAGGNVPLMDPMVTLFGSVHERNPDTGSMKSMLFPNFGSMFSVAGNATKHEEWDEERDEESQARVAEDYNSDADGDGDGNDSDDNLQSPLISRQTTSMDKGMNPPAHGSVLNMRHGSMTQGNADPAPMGIGGGWQLAWKWSEREGPDGKKEGGFKRIYLHEEGGTGAGAGSRRGSILSLPGGGDVPPESEYVQASALVSQPALYSNANMPTHFSEDPPEVINQQSLDRAFTENRESIPPDANHHSETDSSHTHHHDAHVTAPSEKLPTTGKQEITEDDCYSELGFSFPTWKKWYILTVIFWVQVSMNFNTSLYSNAIPGIQEEFGVSAQAARCGAMIFLVLYAFGCELWAPWSEEFGRWPVLQTSLFLVNVWQLPVALAPNFASIMVGRALGGLSSAGGSVTLGMIADMWESDTQQYAVAYVVFSSVGGSVLGPIVGGFTEEYLNWRWSIWIQLILGGVVQLIHFFTVPETRSTIMMNRIAKRRRNAGNPNIWGPDELVPYRERFSAREIITTWVRPFRMFLTEPIVLVLSLLSGFSDALIFMFIQSFALVYKQWHFSTVAIGLAFIPIGIGYVIAWLAFIPAIRRNIRERKEKPHDERAQYESRLWFLLYTAPCLPIGLIGFAWTIQGPPIHWIGSMIFAAIVGIANYSIYMATIDYMICAYGPYSASATGGNGWARDFLAGVLTVPATPFFTNIGRSSGKNLEYASTILFCISFVLVIAVYVIYWKGPALRKRSPFAQRLAEQREDEGTGARRLSVYRPPERRRSSVATGAERPDMGGRHYSQQNRFFGESRVTPKGTPRGTPSASRRNSMGAAPRVRI